MRGGVATLNFNKGEFGEGFDSVIICSIGITTAFPALTLYSTPLSTKMPSPSTKAQT